MGSSEPPITFRHREMMDALRAAREAVDRPITEAERLEGWNSEVLGWIRSWLDECELQLSDSPHPIATMERSWVRIWDGEPGRAFDPTFPDRRRAAVLKASNAVAWVLEFEDLWRSVTILIEELSLTDEFDESEDTSQAALGWLHSLIDRLGIDRAVSSEEIAAWQDTLTGFGATWDNRLGEPWQSGDEGPRFWRDQPGVDVIT